MTALAEHILDTALALANASPWGRLCPPMLACLDELPSTAPLPTLRTRMANERALGISFIYAAQTWRQLAAIFGEQEARALFGLTNVLVMFGGSKDVAFNQEISDLVGTVRVARTTWQTGGSGGRSVSGEDIPILRPEEIRQLPERQALVVAENSKPIIAKLTRCIDGKTGRAPARPTRRRPRPARRPRARRRRSPPRPAQLAALRRRPPARHSPTRPTTMDRTPDHVAGRGRSRCPGTPLLGAAYRDLYLAAEGTDRPEGRRIGDPGLLPAPVGPAHLPATPHLRRELWDWLDDVVTWFNHEYVWDPDGGMIPPCWPQHPHLVHEIAVLADQRRRAGIATTSDALEEWHRYTVPAFLDRMNARLKNHCDDSHPSWPARGRHARLMNESDTRLRAYGSDVTTLTQQLAEHHRAALLAEPTARPNLRLVDGSQVDPDTGEILR